MSFKYSVIGDNTPENREHCEKIGMKRTCSTEGNLIMVVQGTYTCLELEGKIGNNFKDAIHCIGNSALFQAVTAISSTTDIGKYYINNHTGRWKRCDYNMATDENIDWGDWTEATLAELQEHFK